MRRRRTPSFLLQRRALAGVPSKPTAAVGPAALRPRLALAEDCSMAVEAPAETPGGRLPGAAWGLPLFGLAAFWLFAN